MLEQHIKEYLRHVGIVKGVTLSNFPCEICGSKTFLPVCDYVNIGHKKMAVLLQKPKTI
jgi:hypothetical protein